MSFGTLTVDGSLTAEGRIEGAWSTSIGTGGTFQLWPHTFSVTPSASGLLPEQLNSSTRSFGAVRMYSSEIIGLIDQITKDFNQKRAVITYQENGSEKNVYSEHFIEILGQLPELRYLKISVSEPEMYGINRHASIELNSNGDNVILAQSVQESWAIGKSESTARYMGKYQKTFATQFRKFGLTVNIAITIAALAALPGLPNFSTRLGFAASVLGVQSLISYLHGRYVTNFVSYSSETKPSFLRKIIPGVASWTIAIIGAVVAAVIYGALNGELTGSPLQDFVKWLTR